MQQRVTQHNIIIACFIGENMKNELITEYLSKDKKSTSYQVRVPVYRDGKRQYVTRSFSSKKYGSKKLAKEEALKFRDMMKYHAGVFGIESKPITLTAAEVLERKFELLPKSKETERKHRIYFKKHIEPFVYDLAFDKIKASHIQASLNSMIADCSNDTIKRVFSLWKDLYKTAIIDEVVFVDQTIKVLLPSGDKVVKKRDSTTTKEKLQQVSEAILAGHYHDKELIVKALWTMYYTGLRPNEVYALQWCNIDQDKKHIIVCQSVGSDSQKRNVIRKTKTDATTRIQPYPPILDEIWQGCGSDYLFMRSNGAFFNGNVISSVLKKASGGSFTAYMLRKLFATDLIKDGVDIRTVQALMGHTDGATTLGYAQTSQEQMKEAINKRSK